MAHCTVVSSVLLLPRVLATLLPHLHFSHSCPILLLLLSHGLQPHRHEFRSWRYRRNRVLLQHPRVRVAYHLHSMPDAGQMPSCGCAAV